MSESQKRLPSNGIEQMVKEKGKKKEFFLEIFFFRRYFSTKTLAARDLPCYANVEALRTPRVDCRFR